MVTVLRLAGALLATIMVAFSAAAEKADEDSGVGVDGSGSIVGNGSFCATMVLFSGATPPHGFQIQITGGGTYPTYVSDVGSVWPSAGALGVATGPILGGLLVQAFGFRAGHERP
jgi:hypothetical protein